MFKNLKPEMKSFLLSGLEPEPHPKLELKVKTD